LEGGFSGSLGLFGIPNFVLNRGELILKGLLLLFGSRLLLGPVVDLSL